VILNLPEKLTGKNLSVILGLFLCFVFLTGCSQSKTSILRYKDESASKVWPDEPDIPRYKYIGELTGENNIYSEGEGAFTRFFKWLLGLTSRNDLIVLQRPQSGFVDEERQRIYVTDISRGAVFVFDEAEGKLIIWDRAGLKNEARFQSPIGIVPGDNGEVFVADADLGIVVKLNSEGEPIGNFGKGILKRPTGLARDARTKRVFVSDTHAHNIKIFDDAGELIDVIGSRGEKSGEFNFPIYINYAKDQLYVTDSMNARVQIFNREGDFVSKFGKRSLNLGDFLRPKGITVDSEGNIYVVESYYDYLLVYNSSGEFLLPIGGSGSGIGQFYLPSGVWTDSRDRIYVADMFNGRIVIFQYLGKPKPG